MTVFFRCDSSLEIGSGHVQRCKTIAFQFLKLGFKVEFIFSPHLDKINEKILASDFPSHYLSATNLSQIEDANECGSIISKSSSKPNIVFVDHYSLDSRWESQVRKLGKLVVIDDLANRPHDCDLLIDNNFSLNLKEKYQKLIPENTTLILGPKFSFIKSSLIEQKNKKLSTQRDFVLVFFGGTDPDNYTGKFIDCLEKVHTQRKYKILISKSHKYLTDFENKNDGTNYEILIQPANLAEIFCLASIYFGSGGTITWERMFLGLPGVVISIADNQIQIAQELAISGQQIYLGHANSINFIEAITKIEALSADKNWLELTSKKNSELVGCLKAETVISELYKIGLRQVELSDAEFLFRLRNDPSVVSMFMSTEAFSFESHLSWVNEAIKVPSSFFIMESFSQPIGQVRINSENYLSVSIIPEARGRGFAALGLILAIDSNYKQSEQNSKTYNAQIKAENVSSIRTFESAGFKKVSEKNIHNQLFYEYSLLKTL